MKRVYSKGLMHGVALAAIGFASPAWAADSGDTQVAPLYGNIGAFYGNIGAFDGLHDPEYGNIGAYYG